MSQSLFRAAKYLDRPPQGRCRHVGRGRLRWFSAPSVAPRSPPAATMTQVALPELRRYGYSGALATGTLAAGGTLGVLIPPSVILVIYAILTEQNIARLFVAAFVPGHSGGHRLHDHRGDLCP